MLVKDLINFIVKAIFIVISVLAFTVFSIVLISTTYGVVKDAIVEKKQ